MIKNLIICLALISMSFFRLFAIIPVGRRNRFNLANGAAVDAKYFVSKDAAICGLLGFGFGFSLTGLYEVHKTLDVKNLYLFYGGGAHIYDNGYDVYNGQYYSGSSFGINGIAGF